MLRNLAVDLEEEMPRYFPYLVFQSNIVFNTVVESNFYSAAVYLSGEGAAGVSVMDYNLYFQADPAQRLLQIGDDSYDMDEWAAYKSDTGFGAHSPDPQDPLFVDAELGDFHLASTSSAAHDAGTAVAGRVADLYGTSLQGTPDIGAVELVE